MESRTTAWDMYCKGELLHAIQTAKLYPDSKTFVDMPMRRDPHDILTAFSKLENDERSDPHKLQTFVLEHFLPAGSDVLQTPVPEEFSAEPKFLEKIETPEYREWARALHTLWPSLSFVCAPSVHTYPDRHSLLPRRHPFLVPGGRFIEGYYWDSFWVVKGLLAGDMINTCIGMVYNFLDDVKLYGRVPNGGRLYYTNRSQPPLLSEMIMAIVEYSRTHSSKVHHKKRCVTGHSEESSAGGKGRSEESSAERSAESSAEKVAELVRYAVPLLYKEYNSWMEHASVTFDGGCKLNYYGATIHDIHNTHEHTSTFSNYSISLGPRPESYREDLATASAAVHTCTCANTHCNDAHTHSDNDVNSTSDVEQNIEKSEDNNSCKCRSIKEDVYKELRAAAESGWDFSSRWWIHDEGQGGNKGGLKDTKTRRFLPVDLNTYMLRLERNIAYLYKHYIATTPTDNNAGGDLPSSTYEDFTEKANKRAQFMHTYMWDSTSCLWRDLVLNEPYIHHTTSTKTHDNTHMSENVNTEVNVYTGVYQSCHVTAACFIPLWAGEPFSTHAEAASALERSNLIGPGGVSTTLQHTGEQWDYPNTWPPIQWLVVEGLLNIHTQEAKTLAKNLVSGWLNSVYTAWKEGGGAMHEKFDSRYVGARGEGGEYEPQVGFGWTNGVVLDWLHRHCSKDGT